jgi:arylsulfatase A-like enzyme
LDAIVYVDDSIGQMVAELKKQGLLDTTLIIVTAKHGQSPIDPNRFQKKGTRRNIGYAFDLWIEP